MNYPAHPIPNTPFVCPPADLRLSHTPADFANRKITTPLGSIFSPSMSDFSSRIIKPNDTKATIIIPSTHWTDRRPAPSKTIRFDDKSQEHQNHPNTNGTSGGPTKEEGPPNKKRRFQRRNSATAAMLFSQMSNTTPRPRLLSEEPATEPSTLELKRSTVTVGDRESDVRVGALELKCDLDQETRSTGNGKRQRGE